MGKAKVTALERVNSNSYKDDFYESNDKMFCIVCKHVVNHIKKSTIDNHLNSASHKRRKNLKLSLDQPKDQPNIAERQNINLALAKAFVEADIPLEKINKLQNFFKEYCIEGKLINIY